MKLLIATMALLTAFAYQDANAISLRFKFKVVSSGPLIYACNAGIMSRTNNRKVCYFQDTQQTCTPDDCSTTGQNCNSSCVCSSTSGGDYLRNYGKLRVTDANDHHETSSTNFQDVSLYSDTVNVWAKAFEDREAWGKRIRDLTFNMGSELYSSEYFLDVCYHGPQHEYAEDKIPTTFSILAQTNSTDFTAPGRVGGENSRDGIVLPDELIKYTTRAGLQVQAYMACDLQNVGQYQSSSDNSDRYENLENEAEFIGGIEPTGAKEGIGSFKKSSPSSVTGQPKNLINEDINRNSLKAPRFCKIRYIFRETNYNAILPNLRSWQRHGAEMCTFTEIIEIKDPK